MGKESKCEKKIPFIIDCPNMKEVETCWTSDYELYECKVCGERLKAYYDDMR